MEVTLYDTISKQNVIGIISRTGAKHLPRKKDGWQFNWKSLFQTEGAEFYKLTLEESPNEIQGMVMITLMYEELVYMNNIEVAPQNLGTKGRFDNVAGSLIAFACLQAFEQGEGKYKGYLAFTSKTQLIKLYQEKYGATHAMGQKMFFDKKAGIELINKFIYK